MKPFKLILLIAFVFSFIGCKKYDEGPMISLRTAKARLVNDWERGINGSGYVECGSIYINGIEFFKNNTFVYKLNGQDADTGTWEFEDNKTVVILTFDNSFKTAIKWKITRLTRNDLWAIKTCTDKNGNNTSESEFRYSRAKK